MGVDFDSIPWSYCKLVTYSLGVSDKSPTKHVHKKISPCVSVGEAYDCVLYNYGFATRVVNYLAQWPGNDSSQNVGLWWSQQIPHKMYSVDYVYLLGTTSICSKESKNKTKSHFQT